MCLGISFAVKNN
jgi:predicted heme/steroid binding protein